MKFTKTLFCSKLLFAVAPLWCWRCTRSKETQIGISDSEVWDMSCSRTVLGTGGIPRMLLVRCHSLWKESGLCSETQVLCHAKVTQPPSLLRGCLISRLTRAGVKGCTWTDKGKWIPVQMQVWAELALKESHCHQCGLKTSKQTMCLVKFLHCSAR